MNLREKILDKRNIYNAIYCMESYVFDKGLLDEKDLKLYYALADKYDVLKIEKTINRCHKRLESILGNKETLFKVKVYFKLKNYDGGKLDFRPMHTASLTDLICMVSILNCLMFDDNLDKGERKLSDLSKLLPHNFYGNIPSTDVQYLFHRWQNKYKEYTNEVIEHCRTYQKNHKYLTEVCLDIKKFFPSISPKMLFDYITNQLSPADESDVETLHMVVAKLLYFEIDKENIEPWKDYYYPNGTDLSDLNQYMNCGIAQGLPQSYFFGNLCMVEIKHLLMKDDYFNGDAYFYVDDSVIYLQANLNNAEFKEKIVRLNLELEKWCENRICASSCIGDYISERCLSFQSKLNYVIEFHEDGKSVFTSIDDVDNQYGPIANITREASMHSMMTYNLDEIDDRVSLKKLEALDKIIIHEIDELKKNRADNSENYSDVSESRLKILKRFRKFFLYRNRLLKIRSEGGADGEIKKSFERRFLGKDVNAEKFFDQFEEDIFLSEYRLIIQKLNKNEAGGFATKIKKFEKRILEECKVEIDGKGKYLFYNKDLDAALQMKTMSVDCYASLILWAKENYSGLKILDSDKQLNRFRSFLGLDNEKDNGIHGLLKNGFYNKSYTKFVMNASPEYQRRILNVFFSMIMDVEPSDALIFTKRNSRRFRYLELRILAYLRNRVFNLTQFKDFVEHIDGGHVSNQMGIDLGILEVLNVFITNVCKPEWVDSLIMTHRMTKGLWYNGSKFLNSYTLHNEEHAVTLIRKSLELTNRIDYFSLKNVDYYILFLACYLHDISMVIHPDLGRLSSENGDNIILISELMEQMRHEIANFDKIDVNDDKNSKYKEAGKFFIDVFNKVFGYFETLVRDNHAKESAQFICEHSNTLLGYLEPTLLSYVAKVSESHGYDVMDVYGIKSRAKDDTISLKYLIIIIRLADLLDVANDRVNYHLLQQNLKNLSETSKFHWISHLVTDKIELNTDYKSDEKLGMGEKPLTEVINLELFLNFKQMTVAKDNLKCIGCQMNHHDDHLIINISNSETECDSAKCPVLCVWMMKKHEWLIKELMALKEYLFSVNNSLIKTEINFVIHYRDEMRLDADMFDSVHMYLKV